MSSIKETTTYTGKKCNINVTDSLLKINEILGTYYHEFLSYYYYVSMLYIIRRIIFIQTTVAYYTLQCKKKEKRQYKFTKF